MGHGVMRVTVNSKLTSEDHRLCVECLAFHGEYHIHRSGHLYIMYILLHYPLSQRQTNIRRQNKSNVIIGVEYDNLKTTYI